MTNPSNLYAEKIFSEHPLVLWALDDKADYISLINNDQRNLLGWASYGEGHSVSQDITFEDEPQPTTPVNKIQLTTPDNLFGEITFVSPSIINISDLDQDLETFSIGVHLLAAGDYAQKIEIGYQYLDPDTYLPVQKLEAYNSSVYDRWIFASKTFKIPEVVAQLSIVIKITYRNVGLLLEDYTFYTNGITFGQWCEEFEKESLGSTVVSLPTNIHGISGSGVPAQAYGMAESKGYYIINEDRLLAKNTNIPMVYGAGNVTVLQPHQTPGSPSLIIPGNGFLNKLGEYRNYTLEMWLRVESSATEPRKIFGPVFSDSDFGNGIYVHGPFIKIKIGTSIATHFVGDWSRPMLLQFRVGIGTAALMINGEQVISMTFDVDNSDFLPEYHVDSGKSLDWLGFFAYEDVPAIEVDCVAIYGYQVSSVLAKRRFAYGQAVEFPENSNTAYGGTSTFIDYPFAEYTNNYSYPDTGKFGQGILENLSAENSNLSAPDYELPLVVFKNNETTYDSWKQSNLLAQTGDATFINISNNMYLYFNKINPLKQNLKAFYSIFEVSSLPTTDKLLFKIENKISSNYFAAYLNGDTVTYKLNYGNSLQTLYSESGVVVNSAFFVGLDIDSLINFYGKSVASFFGNKSQLEIYIGSDKNFANQFTGKIYKVGFCTEKNFKKISSLFNTNFSSEIAIDAGGSYFGNDVTYWSTVVDGGIPSSFHDSDIFNHTASYTLIGKTLFDQFYLDIAVNSYWEDYLPLTYFAQYVKGKTGNNFYDLDLIQFNIGYAALQKFTSGNYDTSTASVKTYVAFKFDAIKNINYENTYIYTIAAKEDGVVYPGTYVVGYTSSGDPIYDDFMNTKYEVVDGTVIYPPSGIDVTKISMSTHIEMIVDGIITNPTKIKYIQYASEAFNSVTANPVGTRFGTKIYPYKRYGLYYDYKNRNPFRIYKGSTPYLYLTNSTGIQKIGPQNPLEVSGLAIPVNANLASDYQAIALQMALRVGKESFSSTPEAIFEVESKDSYIKFYMVANDKTGKRARIYAVNANTGATQNGVTFYINGKIVRDAVISLKSWVFLGVSFAEELDFNSFTGAIRLTGSPLFNTISIYKSTSLQELQKSLIRPWYRVKNNGLEDLEWSNWKLNFIWNGVLIASATEISGVDPAEIYKAYTGTNKIIVDDDRPLVLYGYEYGMYKYLPTQTKIVDPV